ncbi:hypothetical protein VTL71DRAFT_2596 [Oculimacula yallundae]|uniref:ferric-chelate reductase (NADPH) n=1 Tax=Oculimacula yallundae TaxID=86028 RepID=A0ABR4C9A8_9HELO
MAVSAQWPPLVPSMTDLPITNPRCFNDSCEAFYLGLKSSQVDASRVGFGQHAHWMIFYFVAVIGVFTLVHVYHLYNDRYRTISIRRIQPSVTERSLAFARYVSYSHFKTSILKWIGLPLNGLLLLFLSSVIFVVALSFGVRPYYPAHHGYSSPPLAVRTGFMSLACFPFLIALAGKANIITVLTGVSHEKLNSIHRFLGWISFALAWCHTIPFIWISHTDGGLKNVKVQFLEGSGGTTQWGGVLPLLVLLLLCILSLPLIRHRFSKSFYHLHIILANTYLALLFWHTDNLLDSWTYLWVAVGFWLGSWITRAIWFIQPTKMNTRWLATSLATFTQLPGEMTRVEVLAPGEFAFSPAQHCFLRFPGISLLDNHPFTIASAPMQATREFRGRNYQQTLVFLIRSHSGITRKLAEYCASQSDRELSAWIEGPYGGVRRPIERLYDTLILVAGGAGISACLPWLDYVTSKVENIQCQRIVLIWVMKEEGHAIWAQPILQRVASRTRSPVAVHTQFFVASAAAVITSLEVAEEKTEEENLSSRRYENQPPAVSMEFMRGRPSMKTMIDEHISIGKNFVFGCGPESLRHDLANACSQAQKQVMKGEVQEVALHLEVLGW